jgi:SAM-dependent methyltransferase
MTSEHSAHFSDNLNSWEKRTEVHVNSRFYDVEGFRKDPNSLNQIESEILNGLNFKDGLHVQCHFGMDTLSIARKYDAEMTGVDFSPTALGFAKKLSAELNIPCSFIETNILELDLHCRSLFDLVFASYGVIGWFPSVLEWMRQISQRIRPGGHFLLVEFHPVMWMFDDDLRQVAYAYDNKERITEEQEGTYTDGGDGIQLRNHSWNHNLEEVMMAARACGLQIEAFREYDYSPYEIWPPMYAVEGGFRSDRHGDKLPYVYSLLCHKSLSI